MTEQKIKSSENENTSSDTLRSIVLGLLLKKQNKTVEVLRSMSFSWLKTFKFYPSKHQMRQLQHHSVVKNSEVDPFYWS